MAVTLVQTASDGYTPGVGGFGNAGAEVVLSSTPTAGNTIVISVLVRATETQPVFPTGFEVVGSTTNNGSFASNMQGFWVARKVVESGDPASFLVYNASYSSDATVVVAEMANLGECALDGSTVMQDGFAAPATIEWNSPTGLDTGAERVLWILGGWDAAATGDIMPSAFTDIADTTLGGGIRRFQVGFLYVASTSPPHDYTGLISTGGALGLYIGLTVEEVPEPEVAPEPGIWIDFEQNGFDDGTGSSTTPDALLARIYPQADVGDGGTGIDDNVTPYVMRMTWERGNSYDHSGAESPGGAIIHLKPSFLSSSLFAYAKPGLPVWCGADYTTGSLTTGTAVRGFFAGYTKEFVPIVEDGAVTRVEVVCDDALASYRARPVEVAASTTRSQQEVRAAILDAIDEDLRSLDREETSLPVSAVSADDALAVLGELNRASGSRHYIAPLDTKEDWYAYTSVNRHHKLTSAVDRSIDGDDIDALSGYRITWDTVVNYQKATVTPISFTPDTEIVWEHDAVPFAVDYRDAHVIWAEFDDYVFDAELEVSSALSLGGTVTATMVNYGKTAKITIWAAFRGVVNSLQIRGRQVVRADSQAVIAEDPTSQTTYRYRAGSDISSDFTGQPADAQGVVDFIVWKFANPLKRPRIRIAGKSSTTLGHIFLLDLYDLAAVTIDRLSVSSKRFELVGLKGEIDRRSSSSPYWAVEYELQETPNPSALTLFTVGISAVGGTHTIWI